MRPAFVLRVVNRFQKVVGFDRAIALASAALTATIPLAIAVGAFASQLGGEGTAERIIDRYDLTGDGAAAVENLFAQPSGTRRPWHPRSPLPPGRGSELLPAVQRLFEQTWELSPLSVRNTFNGLLWVAGWRCISL